MSIDDLSQDIIKLYGRFNELCEINKGFLVRLAALETRFAEPTVDVPANLAPDGSATVVGGWYVLPNSNPDPVQPSVIFYEGQPAPMPSVWRCVICRADTEPGMTRCPQHMGDEGDTPVEAPEPVMADGLTVTGKEPKCAGCGEPIPVNETCTIEGGQARHVRCRIHPKTADQIAREIADAFATSACWEITPETVGFKEKIKSLYDQYRAACVKANEGGGK